MNMRAGVVKPLLFMYNVKDLGNFKPCMSADRDSYTLGMAYCEYRQERIKVKR